MRTADDDVGLQPRYARERLVEIEIVASHEGIAHAIDLENRRFRPLPHVRGVKTKPLPLPGRKVRLVVLSGKSTVATVCERRVAPAGRRLVDGVYEHDGATALGRRRTRGEQRRVEPLHGVGERARRRNGALPVARLRQHDHVKVAAAFRERVEFPLHALA